MNESTGGKIPDRWLTIPNALCLIRFFGSLALIPAAISGHPYLVLSIFLLLAFTDWVDGKVARWLPKGS